MDEKSNPPEANPSSSPYGNPATLTDKIAFLKRELALARDALTEAENAASPKTRFDWTKGAHGRIESALSEMPDPLDANTAWLRAPCVDLQGASREVINAMQHLSTSPQATKHRNLAKRAITRAEKKLAEHDC